MGYSTGSVRCCGKFRPNRLEFTIAMDKSPLLAPLMKRLARRDANPVLPVLMYHRIVRRREDAGVHGIYVTAREFESQLRYLKKRAFTTLTFEDLDRTVPAGREVILTFDDG